MAAHRIRARPPRGELRPPATSLFTEADVAPYLRDAASTPGGHAPRVLLPTDEGQVAWALREAPSLLAIGAQSSLTGGATPFGEWVLGTARMDGILELATGHVRAQAGVALTTLLDALAAAGRAYPPAPTYAGAFVGGIASTNAAGAATFKHGSTREWTRALTVVLANGDVLDLRRGEVSAAPDGAFEVQLTGGETRRVPVPRYVMPRVPKRSAGYHAEAGMDLLDLFLGSEGTLGVVTEVELRVVPAVPRLLGFLTLRSEASALELVGALREASKRTWAEGDPRGVDVAAVESLDGRCLDLLREDGQERACGIPLPPGAEAALLFQAELPEGAGDEDALRQLAGEAGDGPLERLGRLLGGRGLGDGLLVALPGDRRRREQLLALREAVPLGINRRIEAAQREVDPLVQKAAADMIVPFERLPAAIAAYREGFASRGLDHAIFGHVSDGNLHANALPRSRADVARAHEAMLEFGDAVIRMGGCPMSEHGVGRNPVKQELLRRLYGDSGVAEMRRVKAALDPAWKLAPGVLFPRRPARS